jgi:hypothetical protein
MGDPRQYSFCETSAAYRWHIRPLTEAGQKFSGGADTKTLCGLDAAWDLHSGLAMTALESPGICLGCRRTYLHETAAEKTRSE